MQRPPCARYGNSVIETPLKSSQTKLDCGSKNYGISTKTTCLEIISDHVTFDPYPHTLSISGIFAGLVCNCWVPNWSYQWLTRPYNGPLSQAAASPPANWLNHTHLSARIMVPTQRTIFQQHVPGNVRLECLALPLMLFNFATEEKVWNINIKILRKRARHC